MARIKKKMEQRKREKGGPNIEAGSGQQGTFIYHLWSGSTQVNFLITVL